MGRIRASGPRRLTGSARRASLETQKTSLVSMGSIRRSEIPDPARGVPGQGRRPRLRSTVHGRGGGDGDGGENAEVRGRITSAARDRFFARGFNSVTMEDLARELGLSKKTIYRFYPSKEALLDGVLDGLAAELGGVLAGLAASRNLGSRERLRRFLVEAARRLAPIQPVFFDSLRRFAPAQLERVEQLRRRNLERHLIPLLRAGRRRGEVRPGIEPAFVVELLLGGLHAMLDPATLRRLEVAPAKAVAGTLDILFHGIFAESEPQRSP